MLGTMMSVFHYDCPRSYLVDVLDHKKSRDAKFSVRKWAKQMDNASHTLLVMLLKGSRRIRPQHTSWLAKGLDLNDSEQLYFNALVNYQAANSPEQKRLAANYLSHLNPEREIKSLEFENYSLIADKENAALISFSALPDVHVKSEKDLSQAVERFSGAYSEHKLIRAFKRLQEFGLIKPDSSGDYRPAYDNVSSKNDVPDSAVKNYHASVINEALEKLQNQPVSQREFQSCSLAIPLEKISEAKEMIRKFRRQFSKRMGVSQDLPAEVFQLNIQFFQLTQNPRLSPGRRRGRMVDTDLNPRRNQS